MLKRAILTVAFLLLMYGFSASNDFTAICAGVAIFLFGMMTLEEGFKAFSGGILERLLKRTTDKTWKSLSFGAVTTSIMQSSSLVSVLTISFLSAGLITLYQGLGIIFGANLGTTTGAWLVAGIGLKVKISNYAMPLLVIGILLIMQKGRNLKGIGYVLAGIGFLFLGIHYMKEGFDAFREQIDLAQYAIPGIKGMLIYTFIGIAATVIMQSSHATLVLTITALSMEQISYSNGLALAIGSNVGTTITAIIGSLTSNIQGRRLAAAHVVFNVVTGLIALIFIMPLQQLVDVIASGLGIAADDYTLKLSVFHTLFNVLGIVLMLPLMSKLEHALQKLLPDKERREMLSVPAGEDDRRQQVESALYLDKAALAYPDAALGVMIKEVQHLYDNAIQVVMQGLMLPAEISQPDANIRQLVAHASPVQFKNSVDDLYERYIKVISGEIIDFGSKSQAHFSSSQGALLVELMSSCQRIVESIKATKHLNKNLRRFSESENKWVAEEYQRFRVVLAELIVELNRIRAAGKKEDVLFADRLRVSITKADSFKNGSLASQIREGRFPGYIAGSIMNDSRYVSQIAFGLIDSLEVISRANTSGERSDDSLSLDETEINQLAQQNKP